MAAFAQADRFPNLCASSLVLRIGCVMLLASSIAGAAALDVRGENVDWSADVVDSDLRKDVHELRGNVRVVQGPMSMQAEEAVVSALRSDHSRWSFSNAVHIRTPEAELRSNSATAEFVKGQIADAQVQGSPAVFEQRGGEPDRQVRGRAGIIEYDFVSGIVKLKNQVWFTYGKDEFRGDTVIYNIRDERVQVNPKGDASGRVNVTIRPRASESKDAPENKPPAPSDHTSESGA